ncbi:MAG: hypothetical protein PF448_11710 [Bacteroidales bacterium]|jgi:hypothetical protein|nr:hypothetical protein [Bacteroidales bacterium]
MNKQKINIKLYSGLAMLLLIAACKPLPLRHSRYVTNEAEIKTVSNEIPFSYYHPDSKIRYDVYNTETDLFLRFDVSDELNLRKIFSYGLEIYIDTLGKRKKTEGFIYPTATSFQQNSVIPPVTGPKLPDKTSINELQKRINPVLILIHANEEAHDNIFSKDSKIDILMRLSEDGNLSYQAKIPLSEFGLENYKEAFTMAILTGDIPENDEDMQQDQNVNMQNQNNPNSYYGGNNMYQPGYQNRPGSPQQTSQNNYRKEFEPLSLWFKVQLSHEKTLND